jgi:hypothetical protein
MHRGGPWALARPFPVDRRHGHTPTAGYGKSLGSASAGSTSVAPVRALARRLTPRRSSWALPISDRIAAAYAEAFPLQSNKPSGNRAAGHIGNPLYISQQAGFVKAPQRANMEDHRVVTTTRRANRHPRLGSAAILFCTDRLNRHQALILPCIISLTAMANGGLIRISGNYWTGVCLLSSVFAW